MPATTKTISAAELTDSSSPMFMDAAKASQAEQAEQG